ncbi:MAG TPA: cysteine desulfurase family protein [Terriglobia bacterium]|nr:cysteine desulfurase family protein [Terriglobia bacterium]
MRRVYLDHNATTPLAPEVFEAMKPYLLNGFGNASSVHAWGQEARAAVEEARESVARLLNAEPSEIVFTSGGTESDNTALFGAIEAAAARMAGRKPRLVTTAIEHPAVVNAAQALEKRGIAVTFVRPGSDGVVDPAEIDRALTPETALISVMHANNELGTLQPIEEIGRIAQDRGVPLHTDAVQSVGKVPIDVRKMGVRLLSLSAHKVNGPKGVGALYVRKGTSLRPLLYGGHHERDRRPGTENVSGIVGLGKAAELALAKGQEESVRIAALRDRLEAGILNTIPLVTVNGATSRRLPSTSNMTFAFVQGEAFVIAADLRGLGCSTGSACASGSLEPSHVLSAIGKTKEEARSTVRFSLGSTTTDEDIDYALGVIAEVAQRLRALSPLYKGESVDAYSNARLG